MTRFAVITGECSTDLEKNLNEWSQQHQRAELTTAPAFILGGEILYVTLAYIEDVEPNNYIRG